MTLRQKHVRWIAAGVVLAVVLAPLAVLTAYILSLRGDAYGSAIARELVTRLRCEATIRGARPAGPLSATADEADLVWRTETGQVAFHLEGISAAKDSSTGVWHVTAAEGRLDIQSQDLRETLGTWNQRLVQPAGLRPGEAGLRPGEAGTEELLTVKTDTFTVAVASDLLNCEEHGAMRFEKGPVPPLLLVHFYRQTEREAGKPGGMRVGIHLDPRSPAGVFQVAQVRAGRLPMNMLAPCLVGSLHRTLTSGAADVEATWSRAGWTPEGSAANAPRHIRLTAGGIDLAEWTARLPGGPVRGTAALGLVYAQDEQGATSVTVDLTAGGGDVSPQTLQWLQGLGAGLRAADTASASRIAFDRLAFHGKSAGGRGQFVGKTNLQGFVPLITARVWGLEVPLLSTAGRTFDARAFWAAFRQALATEPLSAEGK
jgi:hypothetical protein